jgi:hypothetical protein
VFNSEQTEIDYFGFNPHHSLTLKHTCVQLGACRRGFSFQSRHLGASGT